MAVVSKRPELLIESLLITFNALLNDPEDSDWLQELFNNDLKNTNKDVFNRDFYTKTLNAHSDINAIASKILESLNVDPLKRNRYLNMPLTVYGFLEELHKLPEVDNQQLNQFVQLIEQHHASQWRWIALGVAIGSAAGLFPFFRYNLSAIQQFLAIAFIIPSSGLAYTVAMGVYSLYESTTNKIAPFWQLFRDNFFSMLNSVLNIAAWSLLLTAFATTSTVSILFVIADFALVMKEVACLVSFFYWHREKIASNSSFSERHIQIREDVDFEKRKHEAWIHFTAAVVLTIIVAAWCFVPGGIFVAAACMIAIGIVYGIKYQQLKQNEANMSALLETRFSAAELAEGGKVNVSDKVESTNDLKPEKNNSSILCKIGLFITPDAIPIQTKGLLSSAEAFENSSTLRFN